MIFVTSGGDFLHYSSQFPVFSRQFPVPSFALRSLPTPGFGRHARSTQ